MNEEIKKRLEQIRRGELPDGYRRTKKGIVPENWSDCRIETFCNMKSGNGITSASIYPTGAFPCYGGNGLRGYTDTFTHSGRYVLIGRQGALCGNVLLVDGRFYASEHAVVTECNKLASIEFCYHMLRYMNLNRYSEASAQPGLSVQKILRLPVAIPPLTEQQRIAKILSAQDSVIELKERLVTEKLRQKKYLMQQLLSGKQRLPGFHGRWNAHSLCDITERRTTRNIAQCDRVLTISGQYGLIEQWSFFDKTVASADKSNYFFLERDDFAYNKSRSTGYPFGAIKRLKKYDTGIVSPLYICFRISSQLVTAEYMEHYFEANLINQEIKFIAQEGARNHGLLNIGVDDFFNLKVYLPPVDEQMAIADILSAADREIELLRASLEQEKRKKKALSQLLLTGIVRV